ncbi:hypothetical protein [Roseibacillus persicicus]|uniref:hypothetical protein n=1 Tax=Roseibacillus persicicus TaxID=454148 RepID=UPI00280EDE31|nr:hypothetical protein [Roseibacillus persicicus]MDQ8190595.1 hypothetical protein [Roseibacillus persicicus]
MISTVCTLFEGHYHYGVAALTTSLHVQGFRGEVFAGYRGDLPHWASSAKLNNESDWEGCRTIETLSGVKLHFIPVETQYHLTNYKPDFMLKLLEGPASYADSIYYLDPDICLSAPWSYFQNWVKCGVAVCEDVNSPLSENHPRRVGWRRYFESSGISLRFRFTDYVNGGCVGVERKEIGFLECWRDIQEAMAPAVGGLSASKLCGGTSPLMKDPLFCFNASDQDALNAAIEACPDVLVSILGQEAMAFKSGKAILPHALGSPKPWQKNLITLALGGKPPTTADKAYWDHVSGPLSAHTAGEIRTSRRKLQLASGIARFIRRN